MGYSNDTLNRINGGAYPDGRTAAEYLQTELDKNPANNPEQVEQEIVRAAAEDLAGRSAVEHAEFSATQPLPPTEAK